MTALMRVVSGIERARRKGDASTLTLLYAVAAQGRVRPSEVAMEMGVHQSTVTRQVQALAAAGQIEVTPDPDDNRSCFLTLTDAGREEIHRLTEVGLDRFAAFVEDWDANEVQTLGRLLAKLEASKSAVNEREQRRSVGRSWQKRG